MSTFNITNCTIGQFTAEGNNVMIDSKHQQKVDGEVLIILTNFSRPQNIPAVIKAWREQTVPCRIVVVDNSPAGVGLAEHVYNEILEGKDAFGALKGVDDIWRFTENKGCCCWLGPALMEYKAKYILRADDDFVPGRRAVEWLLKSATVLEDRFSTIGQVGRIFVDGHYFRGNVPRHDVDDTKVDLTCRVSFMKTESVAYVPLYRNLLLKYADQFPNVGQLVGTHDDFLLCMASQYYTRQPSYISPKSNDPETELIIRELPQGESSVYKRPDHYRERDQFVSLAVAAGWRSLVQ